MHLPHRRFQRPRPAAIALAELAVGVPGRMRVAILLPQQHERDARLLQLLVHGAPSRAAGAGRRGCAGRQRAAPPARRHRGRRAAATVRPAAVARCRCVETVPTPTAHAWAIARWLSPASYFRRRMSRSFRISSLVAAILDPPRKPQRVAALPMSQRPEPVFTITGIRVHHAGIGVHDARNRCSPSVGIAVHMPEWAFTMDRKR